MNNRFDFNNFNDNNKLGSNFKENLDKIYKELINAPVNTDDTGYKSFVKDIKKENAKIGKKTKKSEISHETYNIIEAYVKAAKHEYERPKNLELDNDKLESAQRVYAQLCSALSKRTKKYDISVKKHSLFIQHICIKIVVDMIDIIGDELHDIMNNVDRLTITPSYDDKNDKLDIVFEIHNIFAEQN